MNSDANKAVEFEDAVRELVWLKKTAKDEKDHCRIVGFEDCLNLWKQALTSQSEWQPISTAPKDGTAILGTDIERVYTAVGKYRNSDFECIGMEGNRLGIGFPLTGDQSPHHKRTTPMDNNKEMPERTYRKRPVEIQTVQWLSDNFVEIDEFITVPHETYPSQGIIKIPTLEGVMEAKHGDWIIRGVQGEFYPCKPDIFEATYERADLIHTTKDMTGE